MIRILVIEDEPTQRLLTCSVLISAGYEVTEAVDGAEGLSLAQKMPPDLVVCDVMMPGLNGFELVTALKSDAALATIPIILLTAMAKRAHMRIGMTAGADDYLYKPFRATELRQSVEALLAKQKLQHKHFNQVGKTSIIAALELQKEQLGRRYEKQLKQELNERWDAQPERDAELVFFNATVLQVNLFEVALQYPPNDKQLGSVIQRVYQVAGDSLYLFGARYLIGMGTNLLAIFPEPDAADGPDDGKIRLQALRSAFSLGYVLRATFDAMLDDAPTGLVKKTGLRIALHTGPVAVLGLQDPLHGGSSISMAVGSAVKSVNALSQHALSSDWRVSCTSAVTAGLQDWVELGKSAALSDKNDNLTLEAFELLAVAQS